MNARHVFTRVVGTAKKSTPDRRTSVTKQPADLPRKRRYKFLMGCSHGYAQAAASPDAGHLMKFRPHKSQTIHITLSG
jgi:hypothetical protein